VRAATRVLDSYGLIAFLENESGAVPMRQVFRSARDSGLPLLLCTVNWGEVFYIALREEGREQAERTVRLLSTLPIEVIPADLDMARQAAIFKARGRISYADCFAAALAKMHKAELVTGDKEFKQLEGEVKIFWL
jgi:predicted nucleic acid-binding protein